VRAVSPHENRLLTANRNIPTRSGILDLQGGEDVNPDETTDPSLRTVYADYWHTYKDTTIQSVSISSAGEVSVTLGDETYKWLKEADISEDEVDYVNCC
jgi:hypothetical protein